MNQRTSFLRKVAYVTGIAALLLPLYFLGQPSIKDTSGQLLPGGVLSRMRDAHGLSQSSLGEIDPAGEAIKLATLGLRGIGANLLWYKATEAKKKEDWTSLSAACEQIVKLQPNIVAVWRFQAWNLSYNCSVEFDDYHDRFHWVMRGVKFLMQGREFNLKETRIPWDLGIFIARKIGRADENREYRRLFKADDDFHGDRPRRDRDNWLVGRSWFQTGVDMVNNGIPLRGQTAQIFFSDPAMSTIYYSDFLEKDGGDQGEGVFDERAKEAWILSGKQWNDYGNLELESSFGMNVRMNDLEVLEQRIRADLAEFNQLFTPEQIEKAKEKKRSQLSKEEQAVLDIPSEKRTPDQINLYHAVQDKLSVKALEQAEFADEEHRARAFQLAGQMVLDSKKLDKISLDRDMINFEYWRLRCQIEQDDDTIAARKIQYDAEEARLAAREDKAPQLYEESFQKWRAVLDRYPQMLEKSTFMDDIVDAIEHYYDLMSRLGGVKGPFILQDVIDHNDDRQSLRPYHTAQPGGEAPTAESAP